MSDKPDLVHSSYKKTTLACLILLVLAVSIATFSALRINNLAGLVLFAIASLGAVVLAVCLWAGAVVLARSKRSKCGKQDLFLELNRSRNPDAIATSPTPYVSRLRRWLACQMLGHDLVAGDEVEVRSWPEIKATLDAEGCLDQLPFMPEMLAMCGQRARVFRCMHRLFDYRKSRRMRNMDGAVLLVGVACDGSDHGGCDAACHTIWKSQWLRRIDNDSKTVDSPTASAPTKPLDDAMLLSGTQPPCYMCQLTQLHAASRPVSNWSPINFLRPLVAGNVSLRAFIVARLTYLFNKIQHLRQGVGFPAFGKREPQATACDDKPVAPGDRVIVRTPGEIRETLNDDLEHRGMGFETDMLKYCGQPCRVDSEVRQLIDIVTGEMRTMKTPAYILHDIHFSGERQLFNAQYEPLFWRGVWLNLVENNDVS